MILKTRLIVLSTKDNQLVSLRSKDSFGILELWDDSSINPESIIFRKLGMDPALIKPVFVTQRYTPGLLLETIFAVIIPHKELPGFSWSNFLEMDKDLCLKIQNQLQ